MWDSSSTSSGLSISKSKTIVCRANDRPPPPVSSALTALCGTTGVVSSFTVAITLSEERSSRLLTLGVASKTTDVQKLSVEGFGKCSASWGVQDERSGSGECVVYAAGKRVGAFRRLKSGDIVSFVVNAKDNWCDIILNFGEYRYRITLSTTPVQSSSQTCDFFFGVSLILSHFFHCFPPDCCCIGYYC